MMHARTTVSTATLAVFALASPASLAGQTPADGPDVIEVVFDLTPFSPITINAELQNAYTFEGEIISADVEAVFNVTETDDWIFSMRFTFPTGATAFSSEVEDWDGTGTFTYSTTTDELNGTLTLPPGQGFGTWFATWTGGVVIANKDGTFLFAPMDGTFETLRLTLTVDTSAFVCEGDCDGSGAVDFNDLTAMLFQFGESVPACDANDSGTVDFNDLTAALFLFGPCE
jgi:hypothetical protein